MSKRIMMAFAGITAGMLALWAPNASAGSHTIPQRMVNAVVECAPAPRSLEDNCQALYLRPHYAGYIDGKAEMEECFTMASEDYRPHSRGWNVYLGKCFRSAILRPGMTD